jgi:competence protein ComEC
MSNRRQKIASLLLLIVFTLGCALAPAAVSQPATATPTTHITSTVVPPTQTPTAIPATDTATAFPATPNWTATALPSLTPVILPTDVPSSSPFKVYFFDVGQGDSTLILSPDGQTALIDGGDSGTGVVQYLQNLGVQRIDLMFATHPHADHIGGLVNVLNAIPVAKVVTSGEINTTSIFERFLDGIDKAGAEYIEAKRGDSIPFGSINFQVLSPAHSSSVNLNNSSLVLNIKIGKTIFLFMGDAEREIESELLDSGQSLDADILKVGHHASKSSSSPAFLSAVSPESAIYFVGIGNSYGHPAQQAISALQAVGATVYGTDQLGTILVTVSANGYQVSSERQQLAATPVVVVPVAPTATSSSIAGSGLTILSVTSPVSKGSTATLTAQTAPGAACTITVYYKSGPSKAQGLEPKTAGADGKVSWSWTVGARTSSGNWRIVVSCTANGNTSTQETYFTVQ